MLPKGKFICMLKKFLIFSNCNFVCFRVFLLYTSIESTCFCKNFHLFPLKIRVKSSFSHPVFGRSGCRLSNSMVIFLPDVWSLAKSGKNFKCSFFITKSAVTDISSNIFLTLRTSLQRVTYILQVFSS